MIGGHQLEGHETGVAILKVLLLAASTLAITQTPPADPQHAPVCSVVHCREPATLQVRLDADTYTELSIPPMPYAFKNAIYVLVGETFRVRYDGKPPTLGDGIYRASGGEEVAALHLRFWQEKDGSSILAIKNALTHRVAYDCAMQLPMEKRLRRTSVLPIEPGLTNYEHWPHPVAHLMLFNIRYEAK